MLSIDRAELEFRIQEYLEFAEDLEAAEEVKQLVSMKNYLELDKILTKRLSFGNGGLLGQMGPGYAAMNDLVVIQTCQGLASYLEGITSSHDKDKGVSIGFDNRLNSERFAHLSALPFLSKRFRLYLFSKIVPTSFVPFSVRKLGCLLGIMVTASQNPKEYNGYKVYWSNGVRIPTSHDAQIQNSILNHLAPWPDSKNISYLRESPLVSDPSEDVEKMYYEELKESLHPDEIPQTELESLRVSITPLHGVGLHYLVEAFNVLGFENYFPVDEQKAPDAGFPTTFPNPEEKGSLELSMITAEEKACDLVLALDADASRLGMAETFEHDQFQVFTSNEMGALLGSWLWKIYDRDLKTNPSNCFMLSTVVSSKILRSLAEKEGFAYYETLPGFHWVSNEINEVMNEGKSFVFAMEEGLGFICGPMVLDKDGIITAMQLVELAAYARRDGKRMHALLNDVYRKYGFHYCKHSFFIAPDAKAVKLVFERLRNFDGVPNHYPKELVNGNSPFRVSGIRDISEGYDSRTEDQKSILPTSSRMELITFYFEESCEVTIRASRIEHKIKYYAEIIKHVPESEWAHAKKLTNDVIKCVIDQWIQPEKNGFHYPDTI